MAEESESKKRIISLGFEQLEELDWYVIYVDFKYHQRHHQVSAVAYSNQKFTCHTPALAGNMLTETKKYATTYTGGRDGSWELDYNVFVKDLAESNNGEVNHRRLIEDGSRLVTRMLKARDTLEIRASDSLEFESD